MKIISSLIAANVIFATVSCFAQTNAPIVFDRLLSCSNTVLLTNAEFRCISGQRIFFLCGGSDYHFYFPSQLDSNELARIGITPEKLQAEADAEARRKAAFAAEQASMAEYRYELSTNVQTIHIFTTDGMNCGSSLGNIVVRGLPHSVISFISQRDDLKTSIQNLEDYHPTITTTVSDPNDPDPQFTADMLNEDKVQEFEAEKKEKLNQMDMQLSEMDNQDGERTMIKAYFTGSRYAGMDVWQFVSMDAGSN